MGSIVGAAKGQQASIQALSQYFVSAPATMATLVSNHDRFAGDRLWSQVQGDTARYKLTAAFQRHLGNEKVLVLINYGTSSANVAVQDLPANAKLLARLGSAPPTSVDSAGRVTLPVGAQATEVYLLQP